jgi:hypothetical protein
MEVLQTVPAIRENVRDFCDHAFSVRKSCFPVFASFASIRRFARFCEHEVNMRFDQRFQAVALLTRNSESFIIDLDNSTAVRLVSMTRRKPQGKTGNRQAYRR